MKIQLSLLIIAMGFASNATAAIDCDDLVGSWRGERIEQSLNTHRSAVSTFLADGTYRAKFFLQSNHHEDFSTNSGTWRCEDNKLTIRITAVNLQPDDDLHVYKILELNPKSMKIKVQVADCSRVVGDCEGVTYDLYKMP